MFIKIKPHPGMLLFTDLKILNGQKDDSAEKQEKIRRSKKCCSALKVKMKAKFPRKFVLAESWIS